MGADEHDEATERGVTSEAFHALDPDAAAERLATSRRGLTADEARERLARHGPNRLEEAPPPTRLATLLAQFKSPLIAILLVAAGVTLAIGEWLDSAVIAVVLAVNAALGYFQERRAEASVRALMGLVAPHARALRDGREVDLAGEALVPGDVVLVQSGDRVPADMRLFAAKELTVDESLLTGESTTVHKSVGSVAPDAQLADRTNLLFTGSVIAGGRGRGFVTATGERTELGRIALVVRSAGRESSPLEARMARFGKLVGIVVAAASIATFALGLALGGAPSAMFLVAVALAVAAVPEGLPVVLTVALSLGVRRMARRRAIIRRLSAVETLGSTSLIGSDKTGTLTENRMTVLEAWDGTETREFTADFDLADAARGATRVPSPDAAGIDRLLLAGVLANEARATRGDDGLDLVGDPTETALLVAAARAGIDPDAARTSYTSLDEIPFESQRRYAAALVDLGERTHVFAKGAPERVLGLSASRQDGAPLDADAILERADGMAHRGLRVLAFAGADREALAGDPEGLDFLGLVGMLDPPRRGVLEAIRDCQAAGIRVVMITGDHAATARAIARELAIADSADDAVVTGADLDGFTDDELDHALRRTSVFARVSPEHKLRVVESAKRLGHVVAVTGDGVNDAPALEHADIGIAMGRSGTDVAREASDMVLTDDDFVSIHDAVEVGRITFDNVRKVTFFLVSTGVATMILIPTSLVLGLPLPLLPAQLLWLNLVTNGLQDVALAFEPGERDVLRRPPRPRKEPIVSRLLWERAGICGLVMAVVVLWLFDAALDAGRSETHARSMALTALVVAMGFHVGTSRSERRSVFAISPFSNRFLIASQVLALVLHAAALSFAPLQFVLRVEPLSIADWVRLTVAASSVLIVAELHKLLRGGRTARADGIGDERGRVAPRAQRPTTAP